MFTFGSFFHHNYVTKLSNVGYNANITLQIIEATHGGLKGNSLVVVHV